jgi:Flp pilus assembly protein TadD
MSPAPSDRMRQLLTMLQREPNDAFLLYGLALENKKTGNSTEALALLDRVTTVDPGYCYAYHQKGLIHESLDDLQSARAAYRAGVQAAVKKGDQHARHEIEAALMMLGE